MNSKIVDLAIQGVQAAARDAMSELDGTDATYASDYLRAFARKAHAASNDATQLATVLEDERESEESAEA